MELIVVCILCAVALLALNGWMSSNASSIAEEKGYGKRKWFHICFGLAYCPI